MGKPEVLAGNIGEALVTTATGLIIAIPAMLFYYYFRNSFIKTTASLGRNIGGLLDTLETGELRLDLRSILSSLNALIGRIRMKLKLPAREDAAVIWRL